MLLLQKHITEGLVQTAVLLSLCGVGLGVGSEPRSWHNTILGPTSVLNQTGFHHHRDPLEEGGHGLLPRIPNLEQFFTGKGLLGWVRSLDRLQMGEFKGLEGQTPDTGSLQSPSVDLELQWENLLDMLPSENTDVEMMTSFSRWLDSGTAGTTDGVEVEVVPQPCAVTQALLVEAPYQQDLLGAEPTRLLLTPSAELGDQSSELNRRTALGNSNLDSLFAATSHTDLLSEGSLEDWFSGLNEEGGLETFSMDLLTPDFMESGNLTGSGVDFESCDLPASSLTPPLESNHLTLDLLVSPSSSSLLHEEDAGGLTRSLNGFLEDSSILEDIGLLDLALDVGIYPEMTPRPEEELHLQQEAWPDLMEPSGEGCGGETDSDSGLSLDFSHSPASSCVSEASTDCSFTSVSPNSSQCLSAEGLLSEDEDRADRGGSDIEGPVVVKQETLEEEEKGAFRGLYPTDVFPASVGDHRVFHSCFWQEHLSHDHTYNHPTSSTCSQSKVHHRWAESTHHKAKSHHQRPLSHMFGNKLRSRDERRARTFRIPFSNELIVHLPVEEFNDLLSNYQLTNEQLALVKDIRRRGKNKIAAHNCRKRKQEVLLGLESEVLSLKHRRSQLLREKREALRRVLEMEHRLGTLYQEVFSKLRDEEGRLLNAAEYTLHFEPNTVASDHTSCRARRVMVTLGTR